MKKITISLMLFFIMHFNCNSQIVYVNQNATGLNNGDSWQNAFTDLSIAINSTSSGQIWVAQGTYIPITDLNGQAPTNTRLNTFKLKSNIAIYGGFSGIETDLNQRNWENYPTIMSGNIGDENIIEDNVIHVFSCEYQLLNSNTILDGLIIKGGYASSEGGTSQGGGIYVRQNPRGSFQVINCIIEENYAEGYGGGLYMVNSDAIIEDCVFRNNVAFNAGGIYMSASNPVISNCEISNNFASYEFSFGDGGGIYIYGSSNPKIFNSTFSNNYATYNGGAIFNNSNYQITFNNNIVSSNFSRDGGALFLNGKSYVFNNLFVNNSASRNGGAVYMDISGNGEFINNTVVYNTASSSGGGLYTSGPAPKITNSIFYYNSGLSGSQIRTYNTAGNWSPEFRYCNIQGGLAGIPTYGNPIVYQDNLDANPIFIDEANNNFRLFEFSTLIDAGTTTLFPTSWTGANGQIINFPITDLDGFQRIVGTIDIGAYEFGSTLGNHTSEKIPLTIYPNPSTGVFNIRSNTNYDSLSVYNIQGIELFKFTEPTVTSIDLTNYPSGLYYVHFLLDNKKYTYKLINK